LLTKAPVSESARKVYLLQRKKGKIGAGLGKTTGWIHRSTMKKRHVEELSGCKYIKINSNGLIIERNGEKRTLEVDTVIFCAGQTSERTLHSQLAKQGGKQKLFMIGGALEAGELDAKRAIDQGTRLAAVVESARSGEVFETPVEFTAKVMKKLQELRGKQ
jgi:2,4-dienoyl-CoA reductase (NADPH2)